VPRLLAVLVALVLVVAACGDDDGTEAEGTTTSTTAAATTTTAGSVPPGELPGQPIDRFPFEGADMAVVGVAADDVLNVRAGPGVEFDVLFTLEPLGGAVATGNNRQLDSGAVWAEVEHDDGTGWANTAFLLQLGTVTDETAALYPTPADRPRAPSMEELAQAVAADVAPSEGPAADVTIVDGPTVGDLGEVTVDVIGVGDDSVGGYRLHVFAEPSGGTFTVRTVEQTVLCSRGVDGELCV
jgi:hypothetical protein